MRDPTQQTQKEFPKAQDIIKTQQTASPVQRLDSNPHEARR